MKWTEGKIADVQVISATRYSDARGWLVELFRSDELPGEFKPVMAYVSVTKRGVARGPHEHLKQTDRFALVGPGSFLVKIWDRRSGSPTFGTVMSVVGGENNPVVIMIPPRLVHGYVNISNVDGVVVNMADKLYRGVGRKEDPDEIRYENDPASVFVLV